MPNNARRIVKSHGYFVNGKWRWSRGFFIVVGDRSNGRACVTSKRDGNFFVNIEVFIMKHRW